MAEMALSDVTVLDFTQNIAGPYSTKLLADYGADVIKVEQPGTGDGARGLGPFPGDVSHPEKSGTFLHLNTNKRGITLDLNTEEGRAAAIELARRSHVVVESFRPGTMESFGLGYGSLSAANPSLVVTSISNFGQTGPYRDWRASELILYGMGGELISTGIAEREPIKMGGTVGLYQAGTVAAYATLAAVTGARQRGAGEHVDISIMETQAGSIDRRLSLLLAYQYTDETTSRESLDAASGTGFPGGVYPCADGYVQITAGLVWFDRVVRMLGSPEGLLDPKWYTSEAQSDPELKEEFDGYFYPWVLTRTKQEVWEAAQEFRVLSGPLNTMDDLMRDAFFQGRGAFAEIDHPEAGALTYPGRPVVLNATPWSVRRPAPRLGEHTDEVLAELGYAQAAIDRMKAKGVI
ncbi:MAG: CoA transferase [SAR202 cluster bacterium]|jgi:formyl-CoA transferase/CoA:oxalate CoA-transferase|nr:hypothetical protein [Chloroflexota bacterium]MDP6420959.1 CaiB/BaiF CoA-transferase family protein [SAR202 cluster bacterium]MDP6665077.1 CaiB/BaiF CoA-transferase family protein [SAR202 cluster bacterium]MDP6799911.1 CaiB/BaiF CoA-transferase family protein [SAR202 cluster bacterium]MQG58131.1 CoA transferase [SAR202 cluster bacterium]|tara:strand:+ start:1785 stop:3005 length:1221 start_codon:yes stop_codon:yes gene_type:complete